jgi:hypothetical protein
MRNIINIFFCFIFSYSIGNAQSIKRSVISSYGSSSSISNTILESTLGQPSNIGTVSDGDNYIRQGFQQPLYNLISIYGCTDSLALNYDSTATVDDGSCTYCANDTSYTNITACDSVLWNGNWYNTSGIYDTTLTISSGYSISPSADEGNNWCFGWSAGLDFNSGAPVAAICSLSTEEGCSSISDTLGNLLFYTDGINVWDKNHTTMPNGTQLTGHFSSTQSAIIIKKPGSLSNYYIFTLDGIGSGYSLSWDGLYFSEVDMTLNGGLGDVISTNKNTYVVSHTAEKIAVIKHQNGIDFWVVVRLEDFNTQNSNTYHSYLLSSGGLNTTPIISNVGPYYYHTLGYLKASPDGRKIAAANSRFTGVSSSNVTSDVNLFDFDNSSGILSNPMTFDFPFNGNNGNVPYGVEFSPNSNLLYVSSSETPVKLSQFNLLAGSQPLIDSSRLTISISSTGGGALQIGPDGKIYHALWNETDLGVINNPNIIGFGCNYNPSAVTLANGTMSQGGLPAFYNSMFVQPQSSCDSVAILNLTITNCFGCTDSLASNYDSTATIDDGNCVYDIYGCTDSLASNYDSLATIDDGSCSYCTNDTSYTTVTACDSFIWNGITYDTSGVYVFSSSPLWSQLGQSIIGESQGDKSGFTVRLNKTGNRLAIGAPFNQDNGWESGHVRVYELNGSTWNQLGDDIDGEYSEDLSSDWNGLSISDDGNIIAIGGHMNDDAGSDAGHARIFHWDGSSWNQLGADIDGESGGDQSGISVSLSSDGNTIAIGASYPGNNDGYRLGHARIYSWDGSSWNQLGADIDGESSDDESGWSVVLNSDGSRVAISSRRNDDAGIDAGHVRVYEWDGNVWNQLGSDINGESSGDQSGFSLSMNNTGNIVAISSPWNDDNGTDYGKVKVFQWDGIIWNQLGQDINGDTTTFGWSISLSDNGTILTSSNVNNYISVYDYDGNNWNMRANQINCNNLNLNGGNDGSGYSISNNENSTTIAFGAPFYDNNQGIVRIYNSENIYGCDSVAVLNLTINSSSTSIVTVLDCDSYDWDGVSYDSTGLYTNIYSASNGCDSTVTLDLTINYSLSSIVTVSACDSYDWDGVTYDSTGMYTNVYTDINGCDSTVTIDLYIGNGGYSLTTVTACDSFLWNSITFNSSVFYTFIFTDSVGCDSTAVLYLTITNSSFSTFSDSTCDIYVWDGMTYDSTGIYTNIYLSSNGCDSTVTLDLNVIGCYGCTDTLASNYDSLATIDDGSCIYLNLGCTDSLACNYDPLAMVDDSTCLTDYGCIDPTALNYDSLATCDDGSCIPIVYGCTDTNAVNYYAGANSDDGSCIYVGCTDSTASNYNPLATIDDGSCTYFSMGCTDSLACNYDPLAMVDDSTCLTDYGCMDSLALNYDSLATCSNDSCIYPVYGCTDPNAVNYYAGANVDDGSCLYAGCTDPLACNYDTIAYFDDGSCLTDYGCMDSTALNYDSLATCDDGLCQYQSNCTSPKPDGLYSYDVIDIRAKIGWNNMNDSNCMVWKYYVRYREVGTNPWTTKSAGVGNGLCNFGLNTVTKQLLNLTPSTTYEFKMKAFYCGGTSSNYSPAVQFTTSDPCPDMTNLTATTFNGNQAKVRFDWDTTGLYVFARILLRVDTAGAAWQTAGGFGVYYPTLFVNKFGLQSGQSYRAQGRTFCDSNITAYRSPTWTAPIFWTQPGTIRLEGGTSITNLNVYPNPSRDLFNISFNSENMQDLRIRILNVIGAEVYSESKEQFVGEYTKQISLDNYGKGIYFLEIETNTGIINKKLILQ